MTATASLIQTLHRINRQKADIKSQLERGPKTVAGAKMRLQAIEQHVEDIRLSMKQMRMAADAKQLQMRERESKIFVLQRKLNEAKENREYQALKDQIAADSQANIVLSDEILEILEGIDGKETELKAALERVQEMQDEFSKIEKQVGDRKLVLDAELTRVENELAKAESELTGDFKRDYSRLVSIKGDDAMAELEDGCCSGCYQRQTPQQLDRLSMGQPVICSCGRLLYQDQERRAY